jgi:hypothetical protein
MPELEIMLNAFLDKVADRVIERISANNSTWLNNIQYKVKAENIEGQIKLEQIESFENEVEEIAERVMGNVSDVAAEAGADAAEHYVKELEFEVSVR